jgi:hypothetical protein
MKGVLFMSNRRNRIRRAFVRVVDLQIEILRDVRDAIGQESV